MEYFQMERYGAYMINLRLYGEKRYIEFDFSKIEDKKEYK
ncbi:conserved hypothetical protein (plasmid) [Borreliella burgdorferi Bol26]|nr:conserved hypothetical protein [Borreliella burgdorferi Bol26]